MKILSRDLVIQIVPIIEELEIKESGLKEPVIDEIIIEPAPDIEPITREHLSFMVPPKQDKIPQKDLTIEEKIEKEIPILDLPVIEEPTEEEEKIKEELQKVEREIEEIESGLMKKDSKKMFHLRDSLTESDLIDSYVNTEEKKVKKEYVPVTRYDASDWINFVFEMKERVTQFISYLPSNNQTKFSKAIDSFVIPKKKNIDQIIVLCASYGLNLAIVALKVLYTLDAFILKAQNPNNSFFVASEEFLQFLEDLSKYCELSIKKLMKVLDTLSQATDMQNIEKRSLWVTILTSLDETEEKIENLHEFYFIFFRNTLQTMLEKVDSEIFWVQKGVIRDNQPVIHRVMEIWKKYIKPFIDKEENLNDPNSLGIPLAMKQIWREIIQFEKSFSLLRKKRF